MPSTVAIIQIDDSSDKTIHGIWQFDKSMGGTLIPPFVTGSLPPTGLNNEIVFSGSKIYRWTGTGWATATGAADIDATYLTLSASMNPNARVLVLGTGLSGSDEGPGLSYTASVDMRQTQFVNDTGPFELLSPAQSAHKVTENTAFPLTVSWYSDAGHTQLIQRKTMVRDASQNPTVINWELYASDGVTPIRQYQETITYSGIFETDRTRTRIL